MKDFQDKIAVITGAASGIGRALADVFAEEGMRLVLADVEPTALAKAASELTAEGYDVLPVVTDVRRAEDVQRLADQTISEFGAVHLVCNNAGVFAGGTLWESPIEDYDWLFGVNVWGVVHGIRTFVPIMLEQDTECHILNTASMAALTVMPFAGIYHATKHAVLALSEALHHELAARDAKIKVSALCPELVSTHIDDAARNRPEELGRGLDTAEARMVNQIISTGMKNGAAPRVLAERALRGIQEDRFYLLADDGWRDSANARCDEIRDAINPVLRPPL